MTGYWVSLTISLCFLCDIFYHFFICSTQSSTGMFQVFVIFLPVMANEIVYSCLNWAWILDKNTGSCVTKMIWCYKDFSQWQWSFHLKAALPLPKMHVALCYGTRKTKFHVESSASKICCHWLKEWQQSFCFSKIGHWLTGCQGQLR